jgi:hypothetical protein
VNLRTLSVISGDRKRAPDPIRAGIQSFVLLYREIWMTKPSCRLLFRCRIDLNIERAIPLNNLAVGTIGTTGTSHRAAMTPLMNPLCSSSRTIRPSAKSSGFAPFALGWVCSNPRSKLAIPGSDGWGGMTKLGLMIRS